MSVKTITIDLEAYNILARRKKAGQSFSQVIKEHLGSRHTVRDFQHGLESLRLSKRTLDAIDRQIDARSRDKAKPTRL